MKNVENSIVNGLNSAFTNTKFADNTERMKALNQMKNSIVEDEVEGETKEATGSGSSGQFSGPIFTEPKKNNLFQPKTEMKSTTKPKGGFVKEEEIEGGLADDKSIMDLAKKHTKDRMAVKQSTERIRKMYDHLEKQLKKGVKVEMEHTDSKKIAKEIALDHLSEDPNYYNKLSKLHREGEKVEAVEATGASSAGQYSQPAFLAPNSKNWGPSKKTQVPGGKFVKVKEKCRRYPYCTQGDTNSIEMWESKMVKDALINVSKTTGLSEKYIKSLVENELKKNNTKTIKEEDNETQYIEFDLKRSDSTNFEDLISDKKSKLLNKKFKNREFKFNHNDLSGKIKITFVGPAKNPIGFGSTPEDYNFSNTDEVQVLVDLMELNYRGEKVPVKFYDMISRYLPEEDEDSYRGDPVERAVMYGLNELDDTLKFMSLYLDRVEINPYGTYFE